jgi:FkbM family methyltransferase
MPASKAADYVSLSGLKIGVHKDRYSPVMIEALRTGQYEANERSLAPRVFAPGDRILEVGSSIGSVSLLLASIVGQENYIGYEANPELMPDIIANAKANGMNILVHTALLRNRARGGAGDPINFYINKDFWISALEPSGNTIRTIAVPVMCLEDEIESFNANALMLDIEGGEVDLLEHADLSRIRKILMELHYWPSRDGANRMVRALFQKGFTIDFSLTHGHTVVFHKGLLPAPHPSSL